MKQNTIDLFFRLVRVGLKTELADKKSLIGYCSNNSNIDDVWTEMRELGSKQGVACILLDGIQALKDQSSIPDSLMPSRLELMKWVNHMSQVEINYKRQETTISKLSMFYALHGIKMLLLKGYGLSLSYPIPSHRPCGDIDIWLYGAQDRGDQLLQKEKRIVIDKDHHHHTIFHVDGVMIENHYNFLNTESHISNKEIEDELHKLIKQENEEITVSSSTAYLPPANFNALFLLRHTGQHFAAMEIALRHVTDWAMFVKHYHQDIDWGYLEQIAKKQNMLRFMQCLNGICVDYLGLSEDIFPQWERDKVLEERIMNDILSPSYNDKSALNKGLFKDSLYRLRRWWGQRWKQKLVYRESQIVTFLVLLRSHFIKPKPYKAI